jgi:hypothetical protein
VGVDPAVDPAAMVIELVDVAIAAHITNFADV